jgi:hypothetical protein
VALAARGLRETEGGSEPVCDLAEAAALRRQARRIHLAALLLAVGATALAVALPE